MAASKSLKPSRRIESLMKKAPGYLEGPDGQRWNFTKSEDAHEDLQTRLPSKSMIFAENGVGDHLFLVPDTVGVMIYRHEGTEVDKYCERPEELYPDFERPASEHSPVRYWKSNEIVRLGDRVQIRLWVFFKRRGEVVYVPGISPKKPSMERDGLAWVRVQLESADCVDTIVLPETNELQRSIVFLARRDD